MSRGGQQVVKVSVQVRSSARTQRLARITTGRMPRISLRSQIEPSDPHGHHDVAVLVVVAFGGAELAGRLRVFELHANLS